MIKADTSRFGYGSNSKSDYVILVEDQNGKISYFYITSVSAEKITLRKERQVLLDFTTSLFIIGLEDALVDAKKITIFKVSKNRSLKYADDYLEVIFLRDAQFLSFTKKIADDGLAKFTYLFYCDGYENLLSPRFYVKRCENFEGKKELAGIQICGYTQKTKIFVNIEHSLNSTGNYTDKSTWEEIPIIDKEENE